MAHEAALEFIQQNHRAVLATYRRDGQVQLSPVLAAVDSEVASGRSAPGVAR